MLKIAPRYLPVLLVACAALIASACASKLRDHESAFLQQQRAVQPANYDTPPEIRRSVEIAYPGVRLQEGEEGFARVAYTIDSRGRIRDFKVLDASHPAFAGYVQLRLEQWRFRPATRDGQPVSASFTQLFNFRIGQRDPGDAPGKRLEREESGPGVVDTYEPAGQADG